MKFAYPYLVSHPHLPEDVQQMLGAAVLFDVQNVAEFFYTGTDQEQWSLFDDFPTLAPPYPLFYMEFAAPAWTFSEGQRVDIPDNADTRICVLFNGFEVEPQDLPAYERFFNENNPAVPGLKPVNVRFPLGTRFMLDVSPFAFRHTDRMTVAGITYHLVLDEHGRAIELPGSIASTYLPEMNNAEAVSEFNRRFMAYLGPALLSLSLMHCKNVAVADRPPRRSPSGRNKHGPANTYKVLDLEPLRERVQRATAGETAGGVKRQLRYHEVRAYFADYREHGLFGKHKMLVWKPQHARGNLLLGRVVKDYRVKPTPEANDGD